MILSNVHEDQREKREAKKFRCAMRAKKKYIAKNVNVATCENFIKCKTLQLLKNEKIIKHLDV